MLSEHFRAFRRRDTGIERDQLAALLRAAPLPHAAIISGLRRAGESTLLAQPATREREVRALTDAMRALGLSRALILADANAKLIEDKGLAIEVRSLAEWLIQSPP